MHAIYQTCKGIYGVVILNFDSSKIEFSFTCIIVVTVKDLYKYTTAVNYKFHDMNMNESLPIVYTEMVL